MKVGPFPLLFEKAVEMLLMFLYNQQKLLGMRNTFPPHNIVKHVGKT